MDQIDVLVTSSLGNIATQTLRTLLASKNLRVRALVRDAGESNWIAHAGGQLVEGDLEHTGILTRALDGVSTLALITPTTQRALEQCDRVVSLSKQAGVRKSCGYPRSKRRRAARPKTSASTEPLSA